MPCLTSCHRDLHRLGIAHFAHNDHIRRLSESRAERGRKTRRVDADFDLLN